MPLPAPLRLLVGFKLAGRSEEKTKVLGGASVEVDGEGGNAGRGERVEAVENAAGRIAIDGAGTRILFLWERVRGAGLVSRAGRFLSLRAVSFRSFV